MTLRPLVAVAAITLQVSAAPLSTERPVDFVVVPVGAVPLAEFEQSAPPVASTKSGEQGPPTTAGGGGSGARVKETDPSEVPPNAVYLEKGDALYQIPCSQNAVGVPVRVPVADSELTLQIKSPANDFITLDKCQLPENATCVLILLTKPLTEKKWTHPTPTLIAIPRSAGAQVLVANASTSASCGAVFDPQTKILLPPLKRHFWRPANGKDAAYAPVALAMNRDGRFLPSLYEDQLTLAKDATSILIAYEVTAQESFRCGKYAVGMVRKDDFRPAEIYQKKQP